MRRSFPLQPLSSAKMFRPLLKRVEFLQSYGRNVRWTGGVCVHHARRSGLVADPGRRLPLAGTLSATKDLAGGRESVPTQAARLLQNARSSPGVPTIRPV